MLQTFLILYLRRGGSAFIAAHAREYGVSIAHVFDRCHGKHCVESFICPPFRVRVDRQLQKCELRGQTIFVAG